MQSDPASSAEELVSRLRQQELVARFGNFALREDDLQKILNEACLIAADGMSTRFAKVLEWRPAEGDLLVRAGIGWRPGTVGHARLGADLASPAGYAFKTGQPVICNDLAAEDRFRTPALLAEHGVQRAINVLVGDGDDGFGVLEVDSAKPGGFGTHDTAFLQALANTLAGAVIKERRQAAVRYNEAFVRGVLDASPDCVEVLDPEGGMLFMNAYARTLMEIGDFAVVQGKHWADLWPAPEAAKVHGAMAEARAGRIARFEAFCPTVRGAPRWWDAIVAPIADADGRPIRLVSISRDVTERAEAATAQGALLREKDMLMQEVHHRVKNSLQLVQGLLGLQARAVDGTAAAGHLNESAARVRTIAALHDRLYRTNAGLLVEVAVYLEGLVAELRSSLASVQAGRDIQLEAEAATWGASEVTTLGLVMTELVTNALKYGAGVVRVAFRQSPDGRGTLTVEDEGPGLPADFDPAAGRGLGMRLVTGLLGGHGGGLEVDRTACHTRFVARLPPARTELVSGKS
jgi:two-component system, sensor histidine kinase PdtaS